MKPKTNYQNIPEKDQCQTPTYGLDPLLPYIKHGWHIWEPACGDGQLVDALRLVGHTVTGSDILDGHDFFTTTPRGIDAIITNPPYSTKYKWLARCYGLGLPFALLLPGETLFAVKGIDLFQRYGVELVIPIGRINFKMPNTGYEGGGAQFPTAWFTHKFNVGRQIAFKPFERRPDGEPLKQKQITQLEMWTQ